MSQLTTHILDTAAGKPATGVAVTLECRHADQWTVVAKGVTDKDGRLNNLLAEGHHADPGTYRLTFDTGSYFKNAGTKSFYPKINVEFEITDKSHYHVPLLLSPYGYSTYRGS